MLKGLIKLSFAASLCVLSACNNDSYDSGQGAYSLLCADFVMAHANGLGVIDYAITDDGDSLVLSRFVQAGWIVTADSSYRAVMYYNKAGEETGSHGRRTVVAEPVSMSAIPVLEPVVLNKDTEMKTDPVDIESVWMSRGGRYMNAGLYLKVGRGGDMSTGHSVGMVHEGYRQNADGTVTACMVLYHDQGDVPEYYSSKVYVSVPLEKISADSVCLRVNTYGGEKIFCRALD